MIIITPPKVTLQCGARNALVAVSEATNCRHVATFTSPLVCGDHTVMAVYPRWEGGYPSWLGWGA